jgi:hypothetical protein
MRAVMNDEIFRDHSARELGPAEIDADYAPRRRLVSH